MKSTANLVHPEEILHQRKTEKSKEKIMEKHCQFDTIQNGVAIWSLTRLKFTI